MFIKQMSYNFECHNTRKINVSHIPQIHIMCVYACACACMHVCGACMHACMHACMYVNLPNLHNCYICDDYACIFLHKFSLKCRFNIIMECTTGRYKQLKAKYIFSLYIPQHRFEQILRKSIQIHNRHHPVLLKLNGAWSSRFQGACSMTDSQLASCFLQSNLKPLILHMINTFQNNK